MNNAKKAMLVMLRGLGFQQKEIADKLEVSQSSVHKYLRKIRERADNMGVERVFCDMLLANPRIDSESMVALGNEKFRQGEIAWLRKRRAEKNESLDEWV